MSESEPQAIHLKDYREPDYRVDHVELEFDLEANATRIKARLQLHRSEAVAAATPLSLDGEDLVLLSIRLDGRPLGESEYRHDQKGLQLLCEMPAEAVLETEVEIDPEANTRLEGLYLSSGNFCTQCEAEGFRRITFYPDRPDVMATFTVEIRGPRAAYPVLLSNGNLVASGELPEGRHFARWDDPFPKPAYLFALVAGDLDRLEDQFATASGRQVELNIYVDKGNRERAHYAMDALKRAMRWDEEKFGLEYDLDIFNIVAVADFNAGAMENKSLNVFNAKYVLADPETATDSDYAGIEAVIAHEYFHNWTGNRVTCRDWFQLSLKEGLTVFRDQQFSADMRSGAVKRIQDVRMLRAHQFPEDAGPLAHAVRPESYIEINNFYTLTIYEKGAEVIRMFHTLLGEAGFAKGMALYFERHDGEAVTCDDFLAAMADANDTDFDQFRLWYSQAGTPEVVVSGHYDVAAGRFDLNLRQELADSPGQSGKQAMHIPLSVGLLDADGKDLIGDRLLDLRQSEQSYSFHGLSGPPVPSVNRGFSAPVKLVTESDSAGLAFQLAHDSDPFNRWDAGQRFATSLLVDMVRTGAAGGQMHIDGAYLEAFARCLETADQDKAYRALLLTLPAESYIGDQMAVVDVDGIHAAREALRLELADGNRETWLELYSGNQSNRAYSPDAAQAGQRALKNLALSYLAAGGGEPAAALLSEQFENADNMTDRMAALVHLNDLDRPERAAALADFHERYKGDNLTIDKWFAVQAMSELPDTLARVKALMAHPAFSLRQPNKVRALIGAFANGNALHFHAADGSGYRFIADRIIELDPLNPQIAARLAGSLGRWRRYDPDRQRAMQDELKRIQGQSGLSRDVYEITSKSLA